jgi:predicted ATPase
MDFTNIRGIDLTNVSQINVVLGKNGCGKSFLLKELEVGLGGRENIGSFRYISPERGGNLAFEAGIDQAITEDPNWIRNNRRNNQSSNFRQQSASLFRRLELLVLREIEREHLQPGYQPKSFESVIEQLNTLLDRVRLERDNSKVFRIVNRTGDSEAPANLLSSGEAELISLGIEFLVFAREAAPDKENILLVDEPDAHLHPDLQNRFARFVLRILKDKPIKIILATHSTSILAGLAVDPETRVAFMRLGNKHLQFRRISDIDRSILPIFGAHPLSNIFNEAPILLVEGEDDERIWQQSVRSSKGKIRVYPCPVESVDRLAEYETEVNDIIAAVYDDAKAFSLRDRDVQPELIGDAGKIIRMRLACRAAENLMLSDDVLSRLGFDWELLKAKLNDWANSNGSHQYHDDVQKFLAAGYPRKNHDLKNIRNIIIGLMTNKPWEVVIGQAIANLAANPSPDTANSLREYLGEKVCKKILHLM